MLILVRELAALELPAPPIMSAIWGNSENIHSLRALLSLTQTGPPPGDAERVANREAAIESPASTQSGDSGT
jgi:hypothetical protein